MNDWVSGASSVIIASFVALESMGGLGAGGVVASFKALEWMGGLGAGGVGLE